MAKMNNQELLAILGRAEQDAVIYNGEFTQKNERLLKDYLQEPYGDEVADQSQVISPDVQNVVESDMPSLARVFLGSRKPISFKACTANERDEQEAEEKTAYTHWAISQQPWSYDVLVKWMKDAEIQQNGVVKYTFEKTEKVENVKFTGLDELELLQIQQDLDGEDVKKIEIVGQLENEENGRFDIEFKVVREKQEFVIINVPTEQWLISKGACSLDDAELVGDRMNNKTRGQLLAEGFDRDIIERLPQISNDRNERTGLATIREKDQGGADEGQSVEDWANELVEIRDLYVKIDYDGDGIAERRHIMKSGNTILINEPFDHVPYASISCIPMPHKAIGRSRAQITQQTQRVKTVMMRQTLDNAYMVNHPRNVLHPDVNMDDYVNVRPNGAVRLEDNTQVLPQNAIFPLTVPSMGASSLQIIQYLDSERAQATGTLMANQGLDADAIAKETATRFDGVRDDAQAKIELVARTFAETGFRKLYEGAAWMFSRFQDSAKEIMVLGKPLTVDPTRWRFNHHTVTNVGLGSGNSSQVVASLQGLLGIQQQLSMQQSPIVDQVKIYNTLDEIVQGLGFKSTDEFFNDPNRPDQLVEAENQILKSTLQQMQLQLQKTQNPLAESEQIRAQAKLIEAQGKQQLDIAKLQEQIRQFNIKTAQDQQQHNQDIAVDLTKIEADTGKDIPGSAI